MFDLNTILNAALQQAVEAHLTQVRQEYANKIGELTRQLVELERRHRVMQDAHVQRIEKLELQSANRHERLLVLEGALTDRVATLEERGTGGGLTREEVREIADEAASEAISSHNYDYDHDEFVSDLNSIDWSDYIDIEDKVRDAVGNLSFEVSVS